MENTSFIAKVSYQVEVWLDEGRSLNYINEQIEDLQEDNKFPKNLRYIDGYFDRVNGSSGCAFLDTTTGETIVGFAGTNFSNGPIDGLNDVLTDVGNLGATGFKPNSYYFNETNEFMDKLMARGYNVTQTTGHSLGGALCVYVGVNYNIPQIVSYNGAPLYVAPTAYLTGAAQSIKDQVENYDGKIIRFVSDKDWLNKISDGLNGFYFGDEYFIHNGESHAIEFFTTGEKAQKYISSIVSSNKFDEVIVSKIDFDGDGNIDLSLSNEDLIVKNLFGANGTYSGNGTTIKINPYAFINLNKNLNTSMVDGDITWINNAVKLCEDKNNAIKNDKSQREDILCEKIVEGLNESSLTQLIGAIDESHGELVKSENSNTIKQLSEFNTYTVTRNFDMLGASANRVWYVGGDVFNARNIIYWVKNLKSAASVLHHQITTNGEFTYYEGISGSKQTYKFDTMSDIGDAFVNTTNSFLSKAEEVFHGTGLRSGKNDGIVNAITEVLEVEVKNIEELKKQILNIAEIGQGIGNNFDSADKWLTQEVQSGNFETVTIPESYTAYLEENNILDDVKDVLEAYDLQVEEASKKLAEYINCDFEDLINRTRNKLNTINDALKDIRIPVEELARILNKNVTSAKYSNDMNSYDTSSIERTDYDHGTLASLFPGNIANCIEHANTYILPHIYSLENTLYILDIYSSRINDLKDYFAYIIEKAVYNSMELDTIISAQNLVTLRTGRMASEIKKVKSHIDAQYEGNSLEYYKTLLQSMVKSIEYFNLMIGDCFGKNSEQTAN